MPKETFLNLIEEKQEKVMRAAISEFALKGFDKANIGLIAKSAGVAKGSIYQYFENKKELFIYSVQWAVRFLMNKYEKIALGEKEESNLFDLFYQNSREIWNQVKEEREIVIFTQDVFLGKFGNLSDEFMEYMLKVSDEILLKYIRNGKKQGIIRDDIDDNSLCLFITGVSVKFKTYMMNKARQAGNDIIDVSFDMVEKDINAMIELLKHGMEKK